MKPSIVVTAVAAVLAAPVSAEQRSATFTVAVTVPVRIALEALDAPAQLELTAQDVARGYVDLTARYRVRHNDRNGFVLEIATLDPARAIEVRDLDAGVAANGRRVAIRRPGAPFEQELSLQLRLVLDPTTAPGAFALPLRVAATPI